MNNGSVPLEIESGIPIPYGARVKKGYSEALRKLQVGESVLLPCSRHTACSLISQMRRAIKNPTDGAFTVRTVDPEHSRVWRIK